MSKNLYTGLNITPLIGDTNSLVVDTNSLVVHSGNTGIGVSAPTAKLQVDGDVTFDLANGETVTINQTNSNAGLSTTATGDFVWENEGKTVIKAQTINSTGRVGIGAEAFGGIAAGVHAFSETDGTTVPHFRVSDSGNNGKFVVWGNGRLDFLGGASDLRLRTNADGKIRLTTVYDGNHYLTITDDTPTVIHKLYTGGGRAGDVNLAITGGDVGIGFTGNPNGKLHVKGSGTGFGTWTAQFHNSTGSNNALMIRDDGNVGIGHSSPSAPLDVDGMVFHRGPAGNQTTSPHIEVYHGAQAQPTYQQLNWSAGNMSMGFGVYYNGGWKVGYATSQFHIYHQQNALKLMGSAGGTLGGAANTPDGLAVNSDGRIKIGNVPRIGGVTPSSALHVTGEGSTNGTSALIVENSSGTDTLSCRDDGVVIMSNLPTSSAGLPAGALWNNSGVINIV